MICFHWLAESSVLMSLSGQRWLVDYKRWFSGLLLFWTGRTRLL